MIPSTSRTFPCPSCKNILMATPGQSAMTCPYCKNQVTIPEAARVAGTSQADAVHAVWGRVVQLAQNGEKDEAIKLYMEASGVNRLTASGIIDSVAKASPQEMSDPASAAGIYQQNSAARMKIMGGSLLGSWKPIALGCALMAFVTILGIIFAAVSYYLRSIF